MSRFLMVLAALVTLASLGSAQTSGFPTFNSLSINGMGPPLFGGGGSVTNLTFSTPTTLNFQVSHTPLAYTPVMLFVSPVPCVPGTFTGGTCQGTVFDLAWTPAPFPLDVGVVNAAGLYNYSITLPPIPVGFPATLGVQAVMFCLPGFDVLFTNPLDVTLT